MRTLKFIKDDSLFTQFNNISNLLSLVIVKDVHGAYHSISRGVAEALGWGSPERALYKTDYDIPCGAVILADKFQATDRKVIDKHCGSLTLEVIESQIGWVTLLVEKTPIVNSDMNVTGVYCSAMDVSYTNFFQYSQMLSTLDQKIISSTQKAAVYTLNAEHSPLSLTTRQQECVFLLVRGKTIKQIATILDLSVRTIESYIEAVKYRLNCTNKSQIIEKAIDSGFLYYIPESILKRDIGALAI